MLKPLFNKNSELVAWISPIQHIFNQNLEWVAYLSNSHAWPARPTRTVGGWSKLSGLANSTNICNN